MSQRLGRRHAEQWLHPLRKALREIKDTGTIREFEGHAIMEMQGQLIRVDHCVDGFLRMIDYLLPGDDTGSIRTVFEKIAAFDGVTELRINLALYELNMIETKIARIPRDRIKHASQMLQIAAHLQMEEA